MTTIEMAKVLVHGLIALIGMIEATGVASTEINSSVSLPASRAKASSGSLVLASESGAALNSNLMEGGGTDDTTALQAILDRAKGGKAVHLIIDGPALVSGLDVYGNTTIECTAGGGLYLKDDANRAILRNAHRSRGNVEDERIAIRGCFFHGNRARQRLGVPLGVGGRYVSRETDGALQSGVQFFGVHYLTLESLTLWNIRAFAVWVGNAKFVHLGNITVDTGLPPYPNGARLEEQRHYKTLAVNDDGVHFQGPVQYVTADGLKLRTVDDALALTANEYLQDMTIHNELGPHVGQGPITDVIIRNVVLMEAHQGIRLLSKTERIDRVLIENVIGTVRQRFSTVGHFKNNSPHTGNFGSVIFSHIAVDPIESPPYLELYPFIKEMTEKDPALWDIGEEAERPLFALNSPIESLTLSHVGTKIIDNRPLIRVGPDAKVQSLNVEMSLQDPKAQAVPVKLMGRIERLNFSLDWKGKAPIRYEGGSIGKLLWTGAPYEAE